jgi:uncharacterized protein (DUF342 family)
MKDDSQKPTRRLDIKLSENKLEAYVSISYFDDAQGNHPAYLNCDELKAELLKAGIKYGFLEDNIIECVKQKNVKDILIARGDIPIDDEDDLLDIKFEIDKDIRRLNEDSRGNIDFKSIGSVEAVLKGTTLAILRPGKSGKPGVDVTGNVVRPKSSKKIKLKASQGCHLLDENTVIADIDGKPSIKNNAFYVFKTHEIPQDVDLKTGNIAFVGDIIINGSVKEGMKVFSGNSIMINNNVESSEIKAKGDIIIKGNVLNSDITGGGEDFDKLKEIEDLNVLKKNLEEMIYATEEIKKFNLLGYNTSDGQIIKLLLESKFKSVLKVCLSLISLSVKSRQNGDLAADEVLLCLKNKLIGLAPLNIKHYSELFQIVEAVTSRGEQLKKTLSIPVNIKFCYCQDSSINSSGDIIVSGKGSYVSYLISHNSIYFTERNSVVRGGIIKSGKDIKCRNVGGHGGVITKLIAGEKGQIWIDAAYENTMLVIGTKEFVMDYDSKNVHAYLKDNYEIIVDRLRL